MRAEEVFLLSTNNSSPILSNLDLQDLRGTLSEKSEHCETRASQIHVYHWLCLGRVQWILFHNNFNNVNLAEGTKITVSQILLQALIGFPTSKVFMVALNYLPSRLKFFLNSWLLLESGELYSIRERIYLLQSSLGRTHKIFKCIYAWLSLWWKAWFENS